MQGLRRPGASKTASRASGFGQSFFFKSYIDGLVQDRSISSALAM